MNDIENAEMDSDLDNNNENRDESSKEENSPEAENKQQEDPDSNIIHQLLNNQYLGQIVDFITNKNSESDPECRGRASGASDINEENSPAEFSNKFNMQRSASKSKTKKEIDESNASASDSRSKSKSFFIYNENARSQKDTEEDESSVSSCGEK